MKQTAVKYGIITGTAIVLYLFIFHQINRELALNPLVYWSPILVVVVGMTLVVKREREQNGGKIAQREALKHAFLTYVIAYLFFTIFIFALFNFIDPGLVDLQKKAMLDAGRKIEGLDFTMTYGKVLFQYAYMLIPGFFLSYMVASFMKK
ncbi:MAG: DUF4199 domain-containing protein [Saprospiraceae bacterium]|nr:DUF4199 domain-containing protein [Saprospiraceae bacterium]MCF8251713.1 DUF4199 domain-containing protein [Saprospiraceae bacterium]MCF8281095.1 DUF4199 domain-containing protein [Bacteroidales bacterium]MCF8311767.1 DUF4199 domain-containing protein [Saprospiraceae bacterium]MCF8441783.1 DUF4199 domain-containing protein [Saprospiraceae bacterium]